MEKMKAKKEEMEWRMEPLKQKKGMMRKKANRK